MTENPRSREHMHSVALTVDLYQGVVDLMSKLKIGKSAAILLAVNEGLHKYGVTSDEVYEFLDGRYRRPLKEIIAQSQGKKESSHTHVLTLEKMREAEQLKAKDSQLKMMLDQWSIHTDPKWRSRALAEATKFEDRLPSARQLLQLGKDERYISQPETAEITRHE